MADQDVKINIWEWVLTKVFSAKFWALLILILSLCWLLNKSLNLMISNASNEKTFTSIKDMFLVMFGVFASTLSTAVTFYFTRNGSLSSIKGQQTEDKN